MSQEYRPPTGPTRRPALRNWPFAIPLLWLLAANAVMQPDAIRARDNWPIVATFPIYDPSDLTALALRGANAHAGRLPGRRDEPQWTEPPELAAKLDAEQPPLAPRYYLEYPTPTVPLFRLPFLLLPDEPQLPPSVADAPQFGVAFFEPRNDDERRLWTRLGLAVRFDMALMTLGLVALMLVLRRGYGSSLVGPLWLAALPGAVYFALHRFDILPTLMTALAFACLGRKRIAWAGVWLAMGVALKVYPILFVPILLRYLGPEKSARFLVAFALVLMTVFSLSWAILDWEATIGPLQVQISRPLEETSWTLYDRILPLSLGHWTEGRLGLLTLAVLATVVTRPRDLAGVLRRCAVVLIVFTVLAVFWSPQWILWFLPLLVPLAGRRPWVVWGIVVLDLTNYCSFPWLFWVLFNTYDLEFCRWLAEVMVYVRAAAWFGVAGMLVRDEVRAMRQGDPTKRFRAMVTQHVEAFLHAGRESGMPRGLEWLSATPVGDPVFVVERETEQLVALLPVIVAFEPVPGSALEDVPQAREPRTVTAMFTFDGETWRTTGRAVFNLSPQQVAAAGRFTSYPKA